MSAPMSTAKLSKAERKARKKNARSKHTLLRHDGIATTDKPTNILFVANAGLGNGIQREEVNRVFQSYGTVLRIDMPTGKPYAFVELSSVTEAREAVEGLNGRTLQSPGELSVPGIKFYLSFIEKVPAVGSVNPVDLTLPPGLIILENYVTEEEEDVLLKCVDWTESAGSLKHRRVKHYGYEFMYGINNVDINKPLEQKIPDECLPLLSRLVKEGHVPSMPDQLTVNEYLPGQGIPPHIDTHSAFEDGIISLALGSQVVMDFKHPNGHHIPVPLPRRCLVVMTKESRYVWTHGITPRKSDIVPVDFSRKCKLDSSDDEVLTVEGESSLTLMKRGTRTSFTFRVVRRSPCNCAYPEFCDSQKESSIDNKPKAGLPSSDNEALRLEETHVHKVYDEIAGHFSDTRHTPWPRIVEFLKDQPPGSILADIGCGNGKYLGVNKSLFEVGCERSPNLADICYQRQFSICVADILSTPLRSNVVDVCLCIAVIHHLSTEERRLLAIKELVRITRPGGHILIYVWALEQELHKIKSNYLKEKFVPASSTENTECKSDLQHKPMDIVLQHKPMDIVHQPADFKSSNKEMQSNISHNASEHLHGASFSGNVEGSANVCVSSESSPIELKNASLDSETVSHDTEPLPIHVNRTQFAKPDLLVPWHLKSSQKKESAKSVGISEHVFHRYYHVFKQGELEALCQKLSDVCVVKQYYDKGNWCIILQKI